MKRNTFFRVWVAAILAAAVLAASFAAASAAPPKADAPPTVTPTVNGRQLILTPDLPPEVGVRWRIKPGAIKGTWDLMLVTAAGNQPAIFDGTLPILFGEGPVPPPPPPPPPPTTLFGIVIEETKERTPAQAVVLLSPKIGALFKANGGQLHIVDPWQDDGTIRDLGPGINPYVKRAIEVLKVRPALFLVDPAGHIFFEGPLPAKVEDVEALIGKIKGGKL